MIPVLSYPNVGPHFQWSSSCSPGVDRILLDAIVKKNLDRVYDTKFLGILIDDKLNWKEHIGMIKSKLSKTTAVIIYRAKYLLDKNSLFILYYSLFLPYISYCCEVWDNTFKTYINGVYTLQKR